MSFDFFGDINWLATVVGALAYFALGALWYSPALFGNAWQASIGWDPEKAPPQMQVTTYVVPLLAQFVMAIAVGLLAVATSTDTIGKGVVLGLVVGLGLSLMHTLVDATFDPQKPKPWVWFWINGSYHALGLTIVAILHAVWN